MQVVPGKAVLLAEARDDDALAVLRSEVLPVDDAVMHVITQFVAQGVQDDAESVAAIVREQVFHVFQQEGARAFGGNDARHVKEQGPLCSAFKAVRSAEGIFFADASDAEWLAGKSGQ